MVERNLKLSPKLLTHTYHSRRKIEQTKAAAAPLRIFLCKICFGNWQH